MKRKVKRLDVDKLVTVPVHLSKLSDVVKSDAKKPQYNKLVKKVRKSHPEVFLGKGVLIICNKFTGEHPCRSVISIKLQSNIFRTAFSRNTSGWLHLKVNVIWTADTSDLAKKC